MLLFLPTILIPGWNSSSPAFSMMYSAYKLNKQGNNYTALTYSFPDLEPVCCSMSCSNCFCLTCIQIFQEADKVVWYSHLLKNFPQFDVIHTVKGFGIVNKAEVDVFLELLQTDTNESDTSEQLTLSLFTFFQGYPASYVRHMNGICSNVLYII